MTEFKRCPICQSKKLEISDDGKTFKVICKTCGNFVEATDTTPISTLKRRKTSASIAWKQCNRSFY